MAAWQRVIKSQSWANLHAREPVSRLLVVEGSDCSHHVTERAVSIKARRGGGWRASAEEGQAAKLRHGGTAAGQHTNPVELTEEGIDQTPASASRVHEATGRVDMCRSSRKGGEGGGGTEDRRRRGGGKRFEGGWQIRRECGRRRRGVWPLRLA